MNTLRITGTILHIGLSESRIQLSSIQDANLCTGEFIPCRMWLATSYLPQDVKVNDPINITIDITKVLTASQSPCPAY